MSESKRERVIRLLATRAHRSWADWTRYIFSRSKKQDDGSIVIPKEYAQRWQRQIDTHYDALPAAEQASDIAEAVNYLCLIEAEIGCIEEIDAAMKLRPRRPVDVSHRI